MAGGVTALLERDRLLVWSGLAALTLGAWAYLVHLSRTMLNEAGGMRAVPGMALHVAPWTAADLGFTVAMWSVMMLGMMLPAAAPTILLFAGIDRQGRARGGPGVPVTVFLLGYLLVWGGFSVAAALLQWGLHSAALLSPTMATTSPVLGGLLLIAAGVYQWTPLKDACLTHCRSPLGFFMTEWRPGARGALRMGLRHGAYCLGCCAVLMGLLFVTGVMNLLWAAVITAFLLVEKAAPAGRPVGRVGGGVLTVAGLALLMAGGRGH